jgi:hypothetical protein
VKGKRQRCVGHIQDAYGGSGHAGNNNSGGSSEWHKNNGIRSNRSSFWDWDFDNDRRRKFVKRQDTGRM